MRVVARGRVAHKAENIYCLVLYRKRMLTFDLDYEKKSGFYSIGERGPLTGFQQ